jgi:hypothetical protein
MLERGKYYHILNKSFDGQNIFRCEKDYLHFLDLMNIFLFPVAHVYAYALLGNHFHFAVKIKSLEETGFLNTEYSRSKNKALKWKTYPANEVRNVPSRYLKIPDADFMLQHLFNSYARWFNKRHDRKGRLLYKSYKHIEVNNLRYMKRLIFYIHINPVKHGFCSHPIEYSWTSYLSFVKNQSTKINRDTVLEWFESYSQFKTFHDNTGDDFFDIIPILIE